MKKFYITLIILNFFTISFLNAKASKPKHDTEAASIKAVENGLRDTVILGGEKPSHMNIFDRMKHYGAPAVSIAVIDKGKMAWAKRYGKIKGSPDSKTGDTLPLFQAASVSKSITAVGALLLVQQGKLSLDKDVNIYLKSWKVPENKFTVGQKVTLRRLLSHSAGTSVGGFNGYSVDQKIPSLVEILKGEKPLANSEPVSVIYEPGSKHQYSGGGTTIVQLLIEDVTGEKFDMWMKRNVLDPFGMRESTFSQSLGSPENQHAVYVERQIY
ncbi:MAG: beta-lactamase family protein [Alphaproteobacteria bacterium]|nr:beta-lactamase family protein [Alphaproteobacteria bacterium]